MNCRRALQTCARVLKTIIIILIIINVHHVLCESIANIHHEYYSPILSRTYVHTISCRFRAFPPLGHGSRARRRQYNFLSDTSRTIRMIILNRPIRRPATRRSYVSVFQTRREHCEHETVISTVIWIVLVRFQFDLKRSCYHGSGGPSRSSGDSAAQR